MMRFLLTTIFGLVLSGCGVVVCEPRPEPEPVRVDHVVRVLMHDPNDYTLMVQDPGSTHVRQRRFYAATEYNKSFCRGAGLMEIYTDVLPEEDVWAVYKHIEGSTQGCLTELHLHSPQEIQGGGWNHGKFGSGQTNVLE